MIPGVQTHFRAWCDPELLGQLKAFGWQMARIDAQRPCQTDEIVQWIRDVEAAELQAYVTLSDAGQIHDLKRAGFRGLDVELRNEPNLEGPDPQTYRALLIEAAHAAKEEGFQLWAPAISNLDRKALAYAKAVGPMPTGVNGACHWYPHGSHPYTPHPGFHSREVEVGAWLSFFGYGTWGVSETGYHTAQRRRYQDWRKNLPIHTRWTDDDVAANVRHELAFWTRMGAAFCVIFQLRDGPDDIPEHRYGLLSTEGTWKPVARVLEPPRGLRRA